MTSQRHALLSSNRYDWRTPDWFLDLIRGVGPIGFDPCTTPRNPTKAREFLTQQLDHEGYSVSCGLKDDWPKLKGNDQAFINPPYGPHMSGPVEPDYDIYRAGKVIGVGRGWGNKIAQYDGNATSLVPVRTETEWWTTMHDWCDLALLWRSSEHGSRIAFVDGITGEPMRGSNLASTVFCRGTKKIQSRFRRVFRDHGTLIP